MPWFKGNTHTHSYVSDGDTSPPEVCAWYAAHGFDFVCMTDHNHPFDAAWLEGALFDVEAVLEPAAAAGKDRHPQPSRLGRDRFGVHGDCLGEQGRLAHLLEGIEPVVACRSVRPERDVYAAP